MRRVVPLPLLLGLLIPASTRAQGDVAGVESALALFDRLGLPSVAGKPFVVVNTGTFSIQRHVLRFSFTAGWLLEDEPDALLLLDIGLVERRIERTAMPLMGWQRFKVELLPGLPQPGRWKELDLEALVAFHRTTEAKAAPPESKALLAQVRSALPAEVESCLFAWWARQRGNEELAARAIERARGSRTRLEGAVASTLARTLRHQAIQRAREGAPRLELLRRWVAIAGLPRGGWSDEAARLVRTYTAQVADDAGRTEPTPEELEAATVEQQAAVWIRRLRDHTAYGPEEGCGLRPVEERANPVERLESLGWDALPLVIEHLADWGPTRSLSRTGSSRLVTVGEFCKTVFEAITGDRLGHAPRDEARAWWAKVQGKGERVVLIEAVSAGDATGLRKAPRLVERWREDAVPALRAALGRARPAERLAFLRLLADLHVDERDEAAVIELLRAEAAIERPLAARLVASHGLLRREWSEALAPMISAWEELDEQADKAEARRLIELLAGARRADAVRALGRDLVQRPGWQRWAVMELLCGGDWLRGGARFRDFAPLLPADMTEDEACERALEELLIAALADETTHPGSVRIRDGSRHGNPRFCDIAAHVLVARWPERFAFDLSAAPEERDRQRAAILAAR